MHVDTYKFEAFKASIPLVKLYSHVVDDTKCIDKFS